MEMKYSKMEVRRHTMLTSTLDGRDKQSSSPASFNPREIQDSRLGGSQIMPGRSGRGGVDTNLCQCRKSNTGRPTHSTDHECETAAVNRPIV